jgi:hypothetical protein
VPGSPFAAGKSPAGLAAYGIEMRPWRETLALYQDERQSYVASRGTVVS